MVNFKKINKNGSVTLPVELRRITGMQVGDGVEARIFRNGILVVPAVRHCVICENTENITVVDGRPLCKECIEKAVKEMESVDNE